VIVAPATDVTYLRDDRRTETSLSRLGGILAVGGFAATVWYFFGPLGSVGFGYPGTDAYLAYERANRLASVPLLVHLVGWILLVRDRGPRRVAAIGAVGSLMMFVGNVGEFWIFSEASYASVERNLSWLTFLLGAVAAIVGFFALAVWRLMRLTAHYTPVA
jgi:hypothetical protein